VDTAIPTAPTSVGVAFSLEEDPAMADVIARLDQQAQDKALAGLDQELLLHDFDLWGRPFS
jgi:hypothetical protein